MAHQFRRSSAAVTLEADAIGAALDGGELQIHAGAQPSGPDVRVSAAPLVTIRFGSPAFGPAEAGVSEARPMVPGIATRSGVAAWFRAVSADGVPIYDGSVGAGGVFDLVLGSTTITDGVAVTVVGFTYRAVRGEKG